MRKAFFTMRIPITKETLKLYRDVEVVWKPDGEKLNPNILRWLCGAILKIFFKNQQKPAIERMRQNSSRFVQKKDSEERKIMNDEVMTGILHDGKHIAYWQIEAFAHAIGLPTGALLSLSHLLSLVRDKQPTEAVIFIRSLRNFVDCLEKQASDQTLSTEGFEEMIRCFDDFRSVAVTSAQDDRLQ